MRVLRDASSTARTCAKEESASMGMAKSFDRANLAASPWRLASTSRGHDGWTISIATALATSMFAGQTAELRARLLCGLDLGKCRPSRSLQLRLDRRSRQRVCFPISVDQGGHAIRQHLEQRRDSDWQGNSQERSFLSGGAGNKLMDRISEVTQPRNATAQSRLQAP